MANLPLPANTAAILQYLHRLSGDGVYVEGRAIAFPKGSGAPVNICIPLDDTDTINSFVQAHSGKAEVYFNTKLATSERPPAWNADQVDVITYLLADIDVIKGTKTSLPASTDDAKAFLDMLPAPPSARLESGSGGLHAIWILDHPIIIGVDMSREDAAKLLAGFQAWINHQGNTLRGYQDFDNMGDLPRIQRAAYSVNMKAGGAICRPLSVTDTVYSVDDIKALIASVTVPSASAPHSEAPNSRELSRLLAAADADWFKQSKKRTEDLRPNPAAIVKSCAYIQNAIDNAPDLPENDWHLSIGIASRTLDGAKIVHAISSPHPGYSPSETDRKIDRALAEAGPATCRTIGKEFSGCATCPLKGLAVTPLDAGRVSADHAELRNRTVYVQATNQFADTQTTSLAPVSEKQFRNGNAHKKFFSHPDVDLLRDRLLRKVTEWAYRPDLEHGFTAQEGKTMYNNYVAPIHQHTTQAPETFIQHMEYLIPDATERTFVVHYLAHLVQKPWEKITHALLLVGRTQGTGKSYIVTLMERVLGEGNVKTSNGRSLLKNFNGHLAGSVFMGIEEVWTEDRRQGYEAMKALITNETDEFERKGQDAQILPTPRGIMLISNHKAALNIPSDDRRMSVISVTDHVHPDRDYYKRLFDFSPESVAAVYWYLKSLDISGFNAKGRAIETNAKLKMIEDSTPEIVLVLREMIEAMAAPFAKVIFRLVEVEQYLRERLPNAKVSTKVVRRALEDCGAVADPLNRQCRFKIDGIEKRERFWFLKDADRFSDYQPKDLSDLFTGKGSLRGLG